MKKIFLIILYEFIAKHLPYSYSKFNFGQLYLRRWILKNLAKKVGKNVNLDKNVWIVNWNEIVIGDNSGLGMDSRIGSVIIGDNVLMGPECVILTRNHNFSDLNKPINKQDYQGDQPVLIEDNVWIGQRVIILPGVKIGADSIIGAGSVVTKNVEKFSVYAGNPAKLIRMRE